MVVFNQSFHLYEQVHGLTMFACLYMYSQDCSEYETKLIFGTTIRGFRLNQDAFN